MRKRSRERRRGPRVPCAPRRGRFRAATVLQAAGALGIALAPQAQAYIGPGAGFAFLTSFFVLFSTFLLAGLILISWPIKALWNLFFRRRPKGAAKGRVVVLGFDGMDPRLTMRFLKDGKMPNFRRLADEGVFRPLETTYPSMSPSAWSSFTTGVDPSRHNIYDFLTRDPCTYLPMLSSAEIGTAKRVLPLGKYRIPLGKPLIRLLRKSQPFWKLLGQQGIFSSILRVPITFPPESFRGTLLSAMCVPDLRGTQGTFSFFTTDPQAEQNRTQGVTMIVTRQGDTVEGDLLGPENTLVADPKPMKLRFTARILDAERVDFRIGDEHHTLRLRSYSPWLRLQFRPGLGIKVHGICRVRVMAIEPHFELYVTPIQIDPENPALPISHPFIYSIYLAKKQGPFATLGLAEDTWALNERAIDEAAFLEQAWLHHEERETMLLDALAHTRKGLTVCVFDTTDRIQHMFFRTLDPDHPANRDKETERYAGVIEDLYRRVDDLLGRVRETLAPEDLLLVISDHGFRQFKRGVNLNAWLRDEGYLHLKEDKRLGGDWLQDVDWSRTRAFSLGLTGLFLNRKGREAQGIVAEGEETQQLKHELAEKLSGLRDGESGPVAINAMFDTQAIQPGPYAADAPDLLIGYNAGYRNSWDAAVGKVTEEVFEDNTKSWSGDHCMDPRVVPGVFFCNRPIAAERPKLLDLAPSILRLFGVKPPGYMQGSSFFEGPATVRGLAAAPADPPGDRGHDPDPASIGPGEGNR